MKRGRFGCAVKQPPATASLTPNSSSPARFSVFMRNANTDVKKKVVNGIGGKYLTQGPCTFSSRCFPGCARSEGELAGESAD